MPPCCLTMLVVTGAAPQCPGRQFNHKMTGRQRRPASASLMARPAAKNKRACNRRPFGKSDRGLAVEGTNWWSCRGSAPRVRNRKPETSQASWIWPYGTLTRIALPVLPAGSLRSREPKRQRANVRYLSRAYGRRVTAGMGGLPESPSRPGSARTRSRQACAIGPTGWRVLEC